MLMPEVALAAAITYYLDLGASGFVMVLPIILLVQVGLWIKNSLFAWARFLLFARRPLAAAAGYAIQFHFSHERKDVFIEGLTVVALKALAHKRRFLLFYPALIVLVHRRND